MSLTSYTKCPNGEFGVSAAISGMYLDTRLEDTLDRYQVGADGLAGVPLGDCLRRITSSRPQELHDEKPTRHHIQSTQTMSTTLSTPDWPSLFSSAENTLQNFPPTYADPKAFSALQIAAYIDHTLLKLDATPIQIKTLCEEAKIYSFGV